MLVSSSLAPSRLPAHGDYSAHGQERHSHTHTEMYVLGDSKSSQMDKEDQPSHRPQPQDPYSSPTQSLLQPSKPASQQHGVPSLGLLSSASQLTLMSSCKDPPDCVVLSSPKS